MVVKIYAVTLSIGFNRRFSPKSGFWGIKGGLLTLGTCPPKGTFTITFLTHVPNFRKIGQKLWSLSWTKRFADTHTQTLKWFYICPMPWIALDRQKYIASMPHRQSVCFSTHGRPLSRRVSISRKSAFGLSIYDLDLWLVTLKNCLAISTHTSGKFHRDSTTKNGGDTASRAKFSWPCYMTFDLWPWKSFQQCALTWWIFMPSTEMISHHAK